MSGICSAHPQHEPGCLACEASLAADQRRRREIADRQLRASEALHELTIDWDEYRSALRESSLRYLDHFAELITSTESALATVSGPEREQLEERLPHYRRRHDEFARRLGGQQLAERLRQALLAPAEPTPSAVTPQAT